MSAVIATELYDITLNSRDNKPLYLQLYDAIRQQILSQRLTSGLRLPASRELALATKVSRNTVQRAYEQLIAEGYLYAKPNSGVFVAVELPDNFFSAKKASVKRLLDTTNNKAAKLSALAQQVKKITPIKQQNNQPLSPGMPDLNYFPQQIWLKLWHQATRQTARQCSSENEAAGLWSLRQAVSEYLRYARAVNCEPSQVIITHGAQQGLDLICRIFLDPGDSVISENPAYMGMIDLLKTYQADIIPCAVDNAGMQVDLLSQHVEQGAKLLYTTPAHQYPLGSIMPIERRLQLLSFAERSDSYIIEDDYDGEFHFDCNPLPSLQGMDQANRVIYVGSFSKVLLPSLRLGYLIVPTNLIDIFTQVKRLASGFSEPLKQKVTADFIQQGHFARHLKRMRSLYAKRLQQTLPYFKHHLARQFKILTASAGMHVTLVSHTKINDTALAEYLARQGFACKALSPYYINRKKQYGLIVGFTNADSKKIHIGIRMIKNALSETN